MLRRNVLIFSHGALGDFVLTFPLALAIARVNPQSRIFYLTSAERGKLVDTVLRLEWADVDAGWHQLFSDAPKLPERAEAMLANANTIFALHDPPTQWVDNVQKLSPGVRLVTVDPKVPSDFDGHATDWVLRQLVAEKVEHAALGQMLQSLRSRGLAGTPAGGGGIVLHPGAGSPTKCWPVDRFVRLGQLLVERGRTVRFVLGEVERDRWTDADRKKIASVFDTVEHASLSQLYQCLTAADVMVGNDSGPAHLAAMGGVPTVALFGPTSPTQWRPLGPHVCVLLGDSGMDSLSVEQVAEAIAALTAKASPADR